MKKKILNNIEAIRYIHINLIDSIRMSECKYMCVWMNVPNYIARPKSYIQRLINLSKFKRMLPSCLQSFLKFICILLLLTVGALVLNRKKKLLKTCFLLFFLVDTLHMNKIRRFYFGLWKYRDLYWHYINLYAFMCFITERVFHYERRV